MQLTKLPSGTPSPRLIAEVRVSGLTQLTTAELFTAPPVSLRLSTPSSTRKPWMPSTIATAGWWASVPERSNCDRISVGIPSPAVTA